MQPITIPITPEYIAASSFRLAAQLAEELRDDEENWKWPYLALSLHGSGQNTISLRLRAGEESNEPVSIKTAVSSGKLRSFVTLHAELIFRDSTFGPSLEVMDQLSVVRNKIAHPREDGSAKYSTEDLVNLCLIYLEAVEYLAFTHGSIDWGSEITGEEVLSLINKARDALFAVKFKIEKSKPEPAFLRYDPDR